MKRGSCCDIVNVNKENQRRNNITLRVSARYPFVWRFKCPYFSALHSTVQTNWE